MTVLLALASLPLYAGSGPDLESQASILAAAKSFIAAEAKKSTNGEVFVEPGQLDSRLRLQKCDQALVAFTAPGGRAIGNTTVGVRCEGTKPWKLYVPVRIRVIDEVVVTSRPIHRGMAISEQDVEYARRDIASLSGNYLNNKAEVVGQVAKYPLRAGIAVSSRSLTRPKLIKRGEGVIIFAQNQGFEVRMQGQALMDGSKGDFIKIKNLNSKRVIEGKVIATGIVNVPL
ncbi:MAG: flagellar basal body P-ring formation chaperone FlgA [Gammaproteobacteria bacterium]